MRRALTVSSIVFVACSSAACRGAAPSDAVTRAAFEGRTADVLNGLSANGERACDALTWAARGGRPRTILAITACGVNPSACRAGGNGWTPLMHAIHKNQRASVAALLQAGADANPPAGAHDLTPLVMAAGSGNAAIVKLLLAAGADPRVTTPNGVSALTIAVSGGALMDIERPLLGSCHPEIVRILVRYAPDLRLTPSLRARVARALANLNGCDEALALADR